jgi:hypothetical protein
VPSGEVMKLFSQGKLHSGAGGPIVKSPRQAIAIKESYLRDEGKVPQKGGFGKAFK